MTPLSIVVKLIELLRTRFVRFFLTAIKQNISRQIFWSQWFCRATYSCNLTRLSLSRLMVLSGGFSFSASCRRYQLYVRVRIESSAARWSQTLQALAYARSVNRFCMQRTAVPLVHKVAGLARIRRRPRCLQASRKAKAW